MNKAEAMFRAFFEDDAEYVLFYLAHKVQIESVASPDITNGVRHQWHEVRVIDDDNELAVFDDKPNFVRVRDNIAVVTYVPRAALPRPRREHRVREQHRTPSASRSVSDLKLEPR